jgi:hypothetical protein
LNLGEKHYQNLVKVLTNNAISSAATSCSDPTLSLQQSSSSTFSNSFDQIDTFRKNDSESFHNSKGDTDE